MDEVLLSTAYKARKERVAGLIKKFVQCKSVPSRGSVTKKEACFASQIPKSVPKILPFNALSNVTVAICSSYCSITNHAFSPQSASTHFVGFGEQKRLLLWFLVIKNQPLFCHTILNCKRK